MSHRWFRLTLGTLALVLTLGATAQAGIQQDLAASSVIETIKQRGTLRVGLSTFVPWAMRNKQGDLIGFEVDVATQVAKDMGVELELVPTAWAGIIPALLAGKFDVIIGGMSITPARNLTVNFTIPYAHSGIQMAANKELAGGFSIEDFNSSDVTLACRRGATPCTLAQELFPKATLKRFDHDAQAFQDVLNGNSYAVLSSSPKPTFYALRYPKKLFMPADDNLTHTDEAFAVRKGDPDALNFFSNWIRVNTSNGWIAKRHHYWFETQDWADQVQVEQ